MALGRHERTEKGRFRRERSDTLAGTLAQEYAEFEGINPRKKLGTLKEEYGVDSLDALRRALRKEQK